MHYCLYALVLLMAFSFSPCTSAQNIDSLSRAVDSSQKALQQSQKDFQRWKDSMNVVRMQSDLQRNGKPLDQFLSEMRERERKQETQRYIRLGLGAIIILAALIFGITRRRKQQKKPV